MRPTRKDLQYVYDSLGAEKQRGQPETNPKIREQMVSVSATCTPF